MKFDTTLLATNLSEIPQLTRQAEAIGFDGIWVSETTQDAFLPLVLVAEHSERLPWASVSPWLFPAVRPFWPILPRRLGDWR